MIPITEIQKNFLIDEYVKKQSYLSCIGPKEHAAWVLAWRIISEIESAFWYLFSCFSQDLASFQIKHQQRGADFLNKTSTIRGRPDTACSLSNFYFGLDFDLPADWLAMSHVFSNFQQSTFG